MKTELDVTDQAREEAPPAKRPPQNAPRNPPATVCDDPEQLQVWLLRDHAAQLIGSANDWDRAADEMERENPQGDVLVGVYRREAECRRKKAAELLLQIP